LENQSQRYKKLIYHPFIFKNTFTLLNFIHILLKKKKKKKKKKSFYNINYNIIYNNYSFNNLNYTSMLIKVARQSALEFNPNVNIKAHHANIKDPQFNIKWFKSFDIVMNALDNLGILYHMN